jgi:NitT/TauT family transport system substrate-binding protein
VIKRFCFIFLLALSTIVAGAEDLSLKILVPKLTSSIAILEIELLDEREDILPGVTVEVEFFVNHAQALARLLNGEVELIFTGISTGWENHLSGGPVMMINTGIWGVSSIVGSDPGFQSLADLAGRTVALPFPGSTLDLQMRYIFEKSGIDPDKDLEIVYAPFPQAAGQLLNGQVDVAPLPEPLATTLVEDKGLIRYETVPDAWARVTNGDPRSPQVSLYTVAETYDVISGVLPMLVAKWSDISEYSAANPGEVAEHHAQRLGYPEEIIVKALEHTILYVPGRAENRERTLEYFARLDETSDAPEDRFFAEY